MRIGNDELRRELEKSIKAGQMTEEFATMASIIANGHIARHFGESMHLRHEFISAFHLAIVQNWQKIKVDGNIHAYISTLVGNRARNVIRSEKKQDRRRRDARYLRDKYINKRVLI